MKLWSSKKRKKGRKGNNYGVLRTVRTHHFFLSSDIYISQTSSFEGLPYVESSTVRGCLKFIGKLVESPAKGQDVELQVQDGSGEVRRGISLLGKKRSQISARDS